jgi:hypothetical protein
MMPPRREDPLVPLVLSSLLVRLAPEWSNPLLLVRLVPLVQHDLSIPLVL